MLSLVSTFLALSLIQQSDSLESRFPYVRPPTNADKKQFSFERAKPDPTKMMALISVESNEFNLKLVLQNPLGETTAVRASDIEWAKAKAVMRSAAAPKIQVQAISPARAKPRELEGGRALLSSTKKSFLISTTNPATGKNQDIAIRIVTNPIRMGPMPAQFDPQDLLSASQKFKVASINILPEGKKYKVSEVFESSTGDVRPNITKTSSNVPRTQTRISEVGPKTVTRIKQAQAQRLAGVQ